MVTVGTTQPATFAKTVYSGFGSKLSHPGPQLPVDGEVSKGRTIYPITRRAVSIDIERLTVQVVGGGANLQDRVSYPSAQIRYTSASVWQAAEICEPAPLTGRTFSKASTSTKLHSQTINMAIF